MVEIAEKKSIQCFHCGDKCKDESITFDDKVFCCNGCKTVYEILDQSSMCDYYSLDKAPGTKVNNQIGKKFAFLDEEKIKNSLLKFQEGPISGVTFSIPSIHCASCIWLLENLHKLNAGIINCSIHFQNKELDIQFDTRISLREVAELLSSLGYSPSITLNGKEITNNTVKKSLYYKLGIAGFCFGNIMMLSLPDYLSVFDKFSGEIKFLFSYLTLLLSLPVFLYSASDYFISSFNGLKNKIINLDMPIALALLAAFGQSIYEIISGVGPGYMDSLTGLVFFLLVGKWYQTKTYESISFDRDFKSYFPLAASKIIDGKEVYVSLEELQPGDMILVKNEEIIPADSIIMEGDGSIDYSFVTGESIPVSKNSGQQIFAGGRQVGKTIKVKI